MPGMICIPRNTGRILLMLDILYFYFGFGLSARGGFLTF